MKQFVKISKEQFEVILSLSQRTQQIVLLESLKRVFGYEKTDTKLKKAEKIIDCLQKQITLKESNDSKKSTSPMIEDVEFTEENIYLKPLVDKWLKYKRTKGQTYKTKATIMVFVNHLHKMSRGEYNTAEEIVDQSMTNNWSGIFETKKTIQKTSREKQIEEFNKFLNM